MQSGGIRLDHYNGSINFFSTPSATQTAGSVFDWNANTKMSVLTNGNIGIGTTTPNYMLTIDKNAPGTPTSLMLRLANSGGTNTPEADFQIENEVVHGFGLHGRSGGGNIDKLIQFWNLNTGNVGIGTTAPAYKLDVAGQIRSSSGGIVFPDGSTQTTAFNPTICGGDYAESVDVTGARMSYQPGDVLVIDPRTPGKFLKANLAYSTLVAGIYSTKPGTVGRRQTIAKSPDEVPMAVVGIVPTKVSAENGPIHAGDLLVSSSTLGRAMKGTDSSKMLGAVVGKALGNLDSGTGVIEVLVTLQ